jgi:hypothetical protein
MKILFGVIVVLILVFGIYTIVKYLGKNFSKNKNIANVMAIATLAFGLFLLYVTINRFLGLL